MIEKTDHLGTQEVESGGGIKCQASETGTGRHLNSDYVKSIK